MEFLLQLIAEMINVNENETQIEPSEELVTAEEESVENIFGMMHFH
ncbi:hypothetical protein [Labilibacter marinus]|nr:hypothetical protein [Labilibacter marinus]